METAFGMVEEERRPGLNREEMAGADEIKKTERTMVTRKEEMLAVVDDFAGDGVAKGVRAPPRAGTLLEQEDGNITRGKTDGSGETGCAPSDDDHAIPRTHSPGCGATERTPLR